MEAHRQRREGRLREQVQEVKDMIQMTAGSSALSQALWTASSKLTKGVRA
jgi:hypothetical protein